MLGTAPRHGVRYLLKKPNVRLLHLSYQSINIKKRSSEFHTVINPPLLPPSALYYTPDISPLSYRRNDICLFKFSKVYLISVLFSE